MIAGDACLYMCVRHCTIVSLARELSTRGQRDSLGSIAVYLLPGSVSMRKRVLKLLLIVCVTLSVSQQQLKSPKVNKAREASAKPMPAIDYQAGTYQGTNFGYNVQESAEVWNLS